MSDDETLEQWAARVAPTLISEQWEWIRNPVWADSPHIQTWSLPADRCAHLLAHRDKVAAGLERYPAKLLASAAGEFGVETSGWLESVTVLCARQLATRTRTVDGEPAVMATDFGREIVRVLSLHGAEPATAGGS